MLLKPSDWLQPGAVVFGAVLVFCQAILMARIGIREQRRTKKLADDQAAAKEAKDEESAKPVRLALEVENAWKECDRWQKQAEYYKTNFETYLAECAEWHLLYPEHINKVLTEVKRKQS